MLNNLTLADSGVYGCTVNNTIVPVLSLNRRLIHVHVKLPDNVKENDENSFSKPVIHYLPNSQTVELVFNFPHPEQAEVVLLNLTGQQV